MYYLLHVRHTAEVINKSYQDCMCASGSVHVFKRVLMCVYV